MRNSTGIAVAVVLMLTGCAGGNVTSNAGGNVTSDAGGNVTSDAGGNVTSDAGGNVTSNAGGNVTSDAGATASGSPGARHTPYTLYTHCGIDDANIGGHWYQAVTPLSDGSGNPPSDWDNPYQQGDVVFISDTEVEFRDDKGHHVRFVLRPSATGPKQICD